MKPGLIENFRLIIIDWGRAHALGYPWRYQTDPYRVLLSEFLLHRTQVNQVLPVYERLVKDYPDLPSFCREDRDRIRNILSPLGLHWRIEGMIDTLHAVYAQIGSVPVNYERLLSFDGVGPYIAGAVVCFTENLPVPLVDTNTVRVVGRVLGIPLAGEARRRKVMVNAISSVCDPLDPRSFYYALIDLAHQVCLPRNPLCDSCPLHDLPCAFFTSY